jgi:hypothetical protein
MTSGRRPAGDEPIVITAATKVTAAEKAELIRRHGTMYAALRAGIKLLLGQK